MTTPLWVPTPERAARANLTTFARTAERRFERRFPDYASLYQFSIERPADFWQAMWDFGGIRGSQGERVVEHLDRMPGAKFFPDARLNFAENVLRRKDAAVAVVFNGEGRVQRSLTFAELYSQSCGMAAALRALGVCPGDRIAGCVPNVPEAVIAAIAAAAIGAV